MWVLAAAAAASLNCADDQAMGKTWAEAVAALQANDWTTVKARTDAMIAACPATNQATPPRVMRGVAAIQEKQYDDALRVIGDSERPGTTPMGAMASFVALDGWAGKRDADGFARERRALVAGVENRLTDPEGEIRAKVVDRFETADASVTAIEGDYANGVFTRHMTFLIEPKAPFTAPRTVMLTTSPASTLVSGRMVYFVDAYSCSSHTTVEIIPKRKPDYKAMRSKVETYLAGAATAVSSTEVNQGGCGFADYVAPGAEG